MRATLLLLLTRRTSTATAMLARRSIASSSSAAAASLTPAQRHQRETRRRLLLPPPLAGAASDGGADGDAERPLSTAAATAASLHRERLAFQREQQRQQRRALGAYPVEPPSSSSSTSTSTSSTSSLDDGSAAAEVAAAAAAQAASSSPSSVRPPRHHQARHYARIVRAWKRGRLGFGFSAGGLLFPYYAGVISEFRRLGIMPSSPSDLRRPHLAGASAGALIAAVANAGVPLPVVEEACVALAADCLANGTPGRLGPGLRALLEKHLPPDAHLRCAGNTHVAVTRVVPVWRPLLVSDFRSRDDLIEALMASAHIPLYLDGRWATRFRGQLVIDGGATSFVPSPPLRHRRRRKGKGSGGNTEGLPPSPSSSPPPLRHYASEAEEARARAARRRELELEAEAEFDPDETEHEDEDEEDEGGRAEEGDAAASAAADGSGNGAASSSSNGAVDAVVKICCFPTWHLASLRTAAASVTPSFGALAEALRADVSPDAFEPFPHDLATVARWALVASPRETFDFLLARGRRDASLFARESGLEAAAAEARREREGVGAVGREPAPPPAPEPPVAEDGEATRRGASAA